jgi:hypothetical protein
MDTPPVVSPEEWEATRQELLVKEKELTRARDALAAKRRRTPWVTVEKEYRFEGPAQGRREGRAIDKQHRKIDNLRCIDSELAASLRLVTFARPTRQGRSA